MNCRADAGDKFAKTMCALHNCRWQKDGIFSIPLVHHNGQQRFLYLHDDPTLQLIIEVNRHHFIQNPLPFQDNYRLGDNVNVSKFLY